MVAGRKRKASRADSILAAILIVGGLTLSGLALTQLESRGARHTAQTMQSFQTPSEQTSSAPVALSPPEKMGGPIKQ